TIRAVPFSLVIGLDLLDLGLDVFSTPITWMLLDRLGLKSLRNIATVKAVVPILDMIPALTLAWLAARYLKLGRPPDPHLIETERTGPASFAPRTREGREHAPASRSRGRSRLHGNVGQRPGIRRRMRRAGGRRRRVGLVES